MGKRIVDTRSNVRTVTKNSFITAAGLNRLSLRARKLLYIAISQCRKNDSDFYEYEISAKQFAELMGITLRAVYKTADEITDELMHGFIKYRPQDKKQFQKYALFSVCSYTDGMLSFKLNPDMTEFLLQIKSDFSQPLLEDFLKMNSPYSMAIWHLMQREMKSKKPGVADEIKFFVSLDEIREVTNTKNKFKKMSDIKRFVFEKALKEIENNCGVKIQYENVKQSRNVIGFNCTVISSYHIDTSKFTKKQRDMIARNAARIKKHKAVRKLSVVEQKEYEELTDDSRQMNLGDFGLDFGK